MGILLVENDPLMLKSMESCLRKGGYDVISAMDGRDAIRKIELDTPEMIITEYAMPSVGGMEIINFVKNIRIKKLPVIVLSKAGLGVEKEINNALRIGADDYISKPFSPDELLNRIGMLYEQKKQLLEGKSNRKANLLYFVLRKIAFEHKYNNLDWVRIDLIMEYPPIKNYYSKEEVKEIFNDYNGIFNTLSTGQGNDSYQFFLQHECSII
jgi:two-component system, OmpR family, response regulator VicR